MKDGSPGLFGALVVLPVDVEEILSVRDMHVEMCFVHAVHYDAIYNEFGCSFMVFKFWNADDSVVGELCTM